MPTHARTLQQRQQLIANVLATAAANGRPLVLANALDTPVRIRDRDTDCPRYVRLRDVRHDDVRCD